jgi:hypothetical protein
MSLSNTEKLDIGSLTGGEREGRGAFDEIMRAVKSHLSEEYSSGRITGDMYAQAYISAVDMALGNANTFTLQHLITNQQVKLLDAQIANQELTKDLIQAQITKLDVDTQYVTKQLDKLDGEIALVDAQVATQTKQLDVMDEAIANAQKDLEAKDAGITYQGKQGLLVDQQTDNAGAQKAQIEKQTLKLQSEIEVLSQRVKSELAQTNDTVDGQQVGGVLGKQIALYQNQADGYTRDAEQKAAKILNDTFLTRVTTEYDTADAVTAGQGDLEVAKVMAKLKQGIGVV